MLMDGVPSWSRHQKLQEEEGISIQWYILNLVLQGILVTAPKIARGGGNFYSVVYPQSGAAGNPGHGTKNCKRRRWDFMMFTLLSGATRNSGHGTKNARGGGNFW